MSMDVAVSYDLDSPIKRHPEELGFRKQTEKTFNCRMSEKVEYYNSSNEMKSCLLLQLLDRFNRKRKAGCNTSFISLSYEVVV